MSVLDFTTVEGIVATFDLPEKAREKIIFRAKGQIEEEGMSFETAYRYICGLFESFELSYIDLHGISLDGPIKEDEEDNFHKLLGRADTQIEELFQEVEAEKEFLSTEQVFSILEGKLGLEYLELLRQLDRSVENFLTFSSEIEVLSLVPKIQERVKIVQASRYLRNGNLVPRPIRDIRFTDTEIAIKFEGRNWEKNDPLDFFRQHQDIYGGLFRYDLQKFDSGLYQALKFKGKMDEAISAVNPHLGYSLSQEDVERIFRGYRLRRTRREIAEYARVSLPTVSRYLREARVVPLSHGNSLPQWKAQKIIRAHELGMSIRGAAKYAGVSTGAVVGHLKRANLKANYQRGRQEGTQLKNTDRELRKVYSRCLGNASRAARSLGSSPSTVRRRWAKMGLDFISKIERAHRLGMTKTEAVAYTGVSEGTLDRYRKKLGLKSNYGYGWRNKVSISPERAEKLKEFHASGMSVEEIAESVEFRDEKLTTISKYLRLLKLRPRYIAENYGVPAGWWEQRFKAPSQSQLQVEA